MQAKVSFPTVSVPDLVQAVVWSGWGWCICSAGAEGQGTVAAGSELAVLLSKIWAVSVAFFSQALSATDPALN